MSTRIPASPCHRGTRFLVLVHCAKALAPGVKESGGGVFILWHRAVISAVGMK
jgi:hypothetical protein